MVYGLKNIYRSLKQPDYQPEGTKGYPDASDLNFDSLNESFNKFFEKRKKEQQRLTSPAYLAEQAEKQYQEKKSLQNWDIKIKQNIKLKNQRLFYFGDIFCPKNITFDIKDIEDFLNYLEEEKKIPLNELSDLLKDIKQNKTNLKKKEVDFLKILTQITQVKTTGLSDQIQYYEKKVKDVQNISTLLKEINRLENRLNHILAKNNIDIKTYQNKAEIELVKNTKTKITQHLLELKNQDIIINENQSFEHMILDVEKKKKNIKAYYRAERKMELAFQDPFASPCLLPLKHKAPNQLHNLRKARKELSKYVPLQFLEDQNFKFKKIKNTNIYQLNSIGRVEIESSDEEDLWSIKEKKQQEAFLQGIGKSLQGEVESYITLLTNPKATIEGFISLFEKIKNPALFFEHIRTICKDFDTLDEISKAEKLGEILTDAILMVMPGKSKLLKNVDYSIKYKAGKALLKSKILSTNQIQQLIQKKKAPASIRRYSPGGKFRNEPKHIHFTDGSALYVNGIWKHHQKNGEKYIISKNEKKFFQDIGWEMPG